MGKSSLLKTILAFLPVGDVRIDGRDVTRLAPHRKRALGLAYAPQFSGSAVSPAAVPTARAV